MPFDAIVKRPWLYQMRAVPSVYHQCVKFVSPTGEKTILGSQKQARACYMSEFRKMPQEEQNIPLARDLSDKDPAKDLSSTVPLDESSPEKIVNIGNGLLPELRRSLILFQTEYQNVCVVRSRHAWNRH